jgi:hypothetical protein
MSSLKFQVFTYSISNSYPQTFIFTVRKISEAIIAPAGKHKVFICRYTRHIASTNIFVILYASCMAQVKEKMRNLPQGYDKLLLSYQLSPLVKRLSVFLHSLLYLGA